MMATPPVAARLASAEPAASFLAARMAAFPATAAGAAAGAGGSGSGATAAREAGQGVAVAGGSVAAGVLAAAGLNDPLCLDALRKLLLVR